MTKDDVLIGHIKTVNNGFVWFGLGRTGKVTSSLEKAVNGAKAAFGKNIKVV